MRDRKTSKITKPVNKLGTQQGLFAFRTDKELAQMLNKVPNKSEFITKALRKQFAETQLVTCWECEGAGKVHAKKGAHKHLRVA